MRHARFSGTRHRHATVVALAALMFGALSACGSGAMGTQSADKQAASAPTTAASNPAAADAAAPSDTPADKTDWPLVPLTQADVQLYLSVMRAAAERVRHPTAEDIAAPGLVKSAELKMQQGHAEQVTAAEDKAIDLAGTLQGHADDLIVEGRHIDAQKYSHIVDRVEEAIVPPQFDFVADGDPSSTPYVPTAHDRAVEATKNANIKLLAPYRDEIRALQATVRDTTPRP